MKDVLTEIRKRIEVNQTPLSKRFNCFRILLDNKSIAYFSFEDEYSLYAPFIEVSEPDYKIT